MTLNTIRAHGFLGGMLVRSMSQIWPMSWSSNLFKWSNSQQFIQHFNVLDLWRAKWHSDTIFLTVLQFSSVRINPQQSINLHTHLTNTT